MALVFIFEQNRKLKVIILLFDIGNHFKWFNRFFSSAAYSYGILGVKNSSIPFTDY